MTVQVSDGTNVAAAQTTLTINNVAPQLQNVVVTSMVDEDGTVTLTADIVDPGTLDTFDLTVNWGDPLSPVNV